MLPNLRAIILLTLPLVSLFGGAALADAIDGDWCHGDGRRLSINGPDITTPGGTHLKGDYDRHHFSYVVPGVRAGRRRHRGHGPAERDPDAPEAAHRRGADLASLRQADQLITLLGALAKPFLPPPHGEANENWSRFPTGRIHILPERGPPGPLMSLYRR